ncbi:hypothetical protein BC834DRAFT_428141 [Gloeopeniophorella convolvens]|nr:hypothetical protein BC834DRAFT_428141 [Gloeopeniophorella convolvens]
MATFQRDIRANPLTLPRENGPSPDCPTLEALCKAHAMALAHRTVCGCFYATVAPCNKSNVVTVAATFPTQAFITLRMNGQIHLRALSLTFLVVHCSILDTRAPIDLSSETLQSPHGARLLTCPRLSRQSEESTGSLARLPAVATGTGEPRQLTKSSVDYK